MQDGKLKIEGEHVQGVARLVQRHEAHFTLLGNRTQRRTRERSRPRVRVGGPSQAEAPVRSSP